MSKNKLLRVSQMDAIHLDNEIERVLMELMRKCNDNLPLSVSLHTNAEIRLLMKLTILYYSIFTTGCTFGQQLLMIKYSNLTNFKKYLYLILSTMGYCKERMELLSSHNELYTAFAQFELIVRVLSLINVTLFLKSGRKPLLIERILGLNQRYAHDNVQRNFGSKYMTRELLWNGLIELIVNILPFVNYHKMRRIIRNLNPLHQQTRVLMANDRLLTNNSKCPHCGNAPVLPHHMGCSHIFCYSCLKGNQMADLKYECPLCGYHNLNVRCERVSAV